MLVNILTCTYNFTIRESPEVEALMLATIKDAMFLFLYHVSGLHIPEAINLVNELLLISSKWYAGQLEMLWSRGRCF